MPNLFLLEFGQLTTIFSPSVREMGFDILALFKWGFSDLMNEIQIMSLELVES